MEIIIYKALIRGLKQERDDVDSHIILKADFKVCQSRVVTSLVQSLAFSKLEKPARSFLFLHVPT